MRKRERDILVPTYHVRVGRKDFTTGREFNAPDTVDGFCRRELAQEGMLPPVVAELVEVSCYIERSESLVTIRVEMTKEGAKKERRERERYVHDMQSHFFCSRLLVVVER